MPGYPGPDPLKEPDPAIIAALSSNRIIGRKNALPWHLSADLRRFKRLTHGKAVLMGRKTHASIGRPLPGRENIVISRNHDLRIAGCHLCASLGEALDLAHRLCPGSPPMVIGGGQLYRQALPLAGWLHLTRVHAEIVGDTHFPDFDPGEWREFRREDHRAGDGAEWAYSFVDYRRVTG